MDLFYYFRLDPDAAEKAKCISQGAAALLFTKYGGELHLKG